MAQSVTTHTPRKGSFFIALGITIGWFSEMLKENIRWFITLLLCVFTGFLGVHRFSVGKIKSGIGYLITMGGFMIGVAVDIIAIFSNRFEKKNREAVSTQLGPLARVFIFFAVVALFEFVYFGNFTVAELIETVQSIKLFGVITPVIETIKRLIGV
jgi:TM2 domain-containing membrane protein YozV